MTTGLKTPATVLVRVNFETKTCRRYAGRTCTDVCVFESEEKITRAMVERIRVDPASVGEPVEKEAA